MFRLYWILGSTIQISIQGGCKIKEYDWGSIDGIIKRIEKQGIETSS